MLAPILSLSFLVLIYFIVGNIFMAIVLEAYLYKHMDAAIGEDDLTKRNPMLLFLFAYFHQLKGISLLKENDEALPEEMSIDIDLLPGMVRNKYLEKRRRNQLLIDRYQGDLTEAEVKRKMSKSGDYGSKRGLASSETSALGRTKAKFWKSKERAMRMLTEAIAIPTSEDFNPPEPEDDGNTRFDLFGQHSAGDYDSEISLNQLQRLIDQEPMLQILLGTKNALDVIRHFKRPPEEEDQDDDPLRKVAELQETVFRKVDKLEKSGLTMDRRDIPFVKDLGDEISQSLSVVQNEWREELTLLVESITTLSDGFAELYDGLEKCSRNHADLMELVDPGATSSSGASSSRSSTSSDASRMKPIAKAQSKFGVQAPVMR